MKKLVSILSFLMLAMAAQGVNVTNYPIRSVAQPGDWFWLSNPSDRTNYNMPYPDLLAQLQTDLTFLGTNNVPANLPIIFLKPDGSYSYNGVAYTTTNSPTSGIQEAITTLAGTRDGSTNRTGGGTIMLAPGTFYTTTNIFTPWGKNLFTLNIIGAGQTSSGITYIGSNTNEVLTVGTASTSAQGVIAFSMKDMWIFSGLDSNSSLVHLFGRTHTIGASSQVGMVLVDRVWFRCGTNLNWYTHELAGNQRNLIGLDVDCNFNNPIVVRDNIFFDLGCGISWACDWGTIQNNEFIFCSNEGAAQNSWPSSSPYYIGAGVLFTESKSEVGRLNGNKGWYVFGNSFIDCAPQYVSILASNTLNNYDFINRVAVWQDSRENYWTGEVLAATAGCNISFIDGHFYDLNGQRTGTYTTCLITNTADYTTWNDTPCPPDVISFTSFEDPTRGTSFLQGVNVAPTPQQIGGTVGIITNHLLKNVNGSLIDYYSDGTTLWTKQLVP